MEKKLLDRAEAIEALNKEIEKAKPPFNDTLGAIRHGVRLARNIIEDLPVECGQAPRLGRWEIIDKGPELEGGQIVVRPPAIKCTACGSEAVVVLHMGPVLTPFCPWCGAQMANEERRQRND